MPTRIVTSGETGAHLPPAEQLIGDATTTVRGTHSYVGTIVVSATAATLPWTAAWSRNPENADAMGSASAAHVPSDFGSTAVPLRSSAAMSRALSSRVEPSLSSTTYRV